MIPVNNDVDRVMRSIFRRCIECTNDEIKCFACPTGESCSFSVRTCDACSQATCVADTMIDPSANTAIQPSTSEGPNIGGIAGGVIGGIAAIAIVTYLVWRFCIKGRRQEYEESEWSQTDLPPEKRQTDFTMRRDARMSTHTVASIASTVLTRASNIIQIAYIPGITNRSGPQSPDTLVPPVPPIPIMLNNSAPSSPYSHTEDSHYFMPGDLRSVRGSTYSGMSGMTGMTGFSDDNRSSFHTMHSRQSITPSLARSSVATTIYRNDAVVNPMPAQTIVRGKAAVVSVKGSSPLGTPNSGNTPPVPQIQFDRLQRPNVQLHMPSNSSLRSSAQGSFVSTASTAKPIPVSMKPSIISMNSYSSLKAGTAGRPSTVSSSTSESDPEDENTRARRSLLPQDRDSSITEIADTPGVNQSPFADMSATITSPNFMPRSASGLGALDPVAESDESKRESAHIARSRSPFGDEHELR